MKARKFVLIYFKTVKATQSTQGKKKKYSARQSQHAAKRNELAPEQRKSWPQNKLANSLGAGYASYFKAVFCARVVAVCDFEVVLAI